jgi:hypothetical protein
MIEELKERRHLPPLSEDDVQRIANAVSDRAIKSCQSSFHLAEEKHYNDHKRLDRILDMYDNASNVIVKTFIAMIFVGALALAAMGKFKGN